jgi:hypothetical protein
MRRAAHTIRIGEIRNADKILVGKPEKKSYLGDLDVDGWILLKWILETGFYDVTWIRLTQDRGQSRDLLNTVMKLRFL